MRVFRCLYMLLGLVFCVFQAWCERICGTEFTDAGSSAYLADIVLEGEVTVMWDPNSAGVYNVSLKVPRRKTYKVYKDSSGSVQRVLEKSRGVINVGEFGTENKVRCVTDIVRNTRYMFFLRATESPEYFRISAFPLSTSGSKKASKKIRRLLNSIVCSKCAKAPRINKRLKSISVEAGKKITLKCGASGNPRPRIRWERNGKVLRRAKGMRIKTGKRGSRLQYRKASKKAHGEYKCIAENVVKRVEKKVQITVIQKPVVTTAPRFEACHKKYNGHCLNNGTCLYSPELKEKFCRCSKEFSGKRCEYREFFTVYGPIETKAKLDHERTLIVIGIVIAILVFIVICILSYYLAKQKRTSFYKRREERKREVVNEPYKPLLRDEVDSMPIRIKKKHSMTTQTEESVFALIESGRLTSEGQPIQPVTANHIFANFPNSSPVHMRDKPVTTNAQPPLRDRLNAVSVEVEDSARNELDEPDTPEVPPQPTDKGPSGENPGDSASSHSSSSLPTEPTFPVPTQSPASDNSTTNGDFPDPPPEAHTQGQEGDAPSSDEEDIEAALLSKHPELRVHLHISEEDLSNRNKSVSLESPDNRKSPDEQEPSTDLTQVVPGEGVQVSNPGVHSGVADQLRQPGVNCNGFPVSEGLYDESSSEDSSNTSSSSESLVDPGSLPAILSLENPHTKQPDNHVSWDEHGTPVISQYACNPYAMDLDDDFVNSQLYEPANFRLFGNLESPPPPPVEDKLRNVREDQDPVPL